MLRSALPTFIAFDLLLLTLPVRFALCLWLLVDVPVPAPLRVITYRYAHYRCQFQYAFLRSRIAFTRTCAHAVLFITHHLHLPSLPRFPTVTFALLHYVRPRSPYTVTLTFGYATPAHAFRRYAVPRSLRYRITFAIFPHRVYRNVPQHSFTHTFPIHL